MFSHISHLGENSCFRGSNQLLRMAGLLGFEGGEAEWDKEYVVLCRSYNWILGNSQNAVSEHFPDWKKTYVLTGFKLALWFCPKVVFPKCVAPFVSSTSSTSSHCFPCSPCGRNQDHDLVEKICDHFGKRSWNQFFTSCFYYLSNFYQIYNVYIYTIYIYIEYEFIHRKENTSRVSVRFRFSRGSLRLMTGMQPLVQVAGGLMSLTARFPYRFWTKQSVVMVPEK